MIPQSGWALHVCVFTLKFVSEVAAFTALTDFLLITVHFVLCGIFVFVVCCIYNEDVRACSLAAESRKREVA